MLQSLAPLMRLAAANAPQPGENGAAILSGMDSPSNVGALSSIAPNPNAKMVLPDGSEGEIGGDQYARDSGVFNSALDAERSTTPSSLRALMEQADAHRYGEASALSDLNSGVPAALATASGPVQDIQAENAAGAQLGPYASELRDINNAAKQRELETQYITGPTIKAAGDQAVAQTDAQGRIAAAQVGHAPMPALEGFRQAVAKLYESGRDTPEAIAALAKTYGVQVPQ